MSKGLAAKALQIARSIPKIEIVDEDPINPQEGVLYFVPKDGGGGIPVKDYFFRFDAHSLDLADNAKVSLWQDLSGNGNDLEQTESSLQPTFLTTGFNGKPTVQFSDHYLERSPFTLNNVNGATSFLVVEIENKSSTSVPFAVGEQGVKNHSYAMRASGSQQSVGVYVNSFDAVANAALSIDLNGRLYSSSYDGSKIKMYQDGVFANETSFSEPITTHDTLRVGNNATNTNPQPFGGKISELIYFSRALSDTEVQEMNEYLMEKWGI